MNRLSNAFVVGVVISGISCAAAAQQVSFEDAAIKVLRCEETPHVLPLLEALERAGKISGNDILGYDSISCFRISGGVSIKGMKFNSICGHEENAAVRDRRPDLLYRGPGTSPGQFVSFGTAVADHVVARWYFENIGTTHLNKAIDSEYTYIGDTTDVTCSEWFVR